VAEVSESSNAQEASGRGDSDSLSTARVIEIPHRLSVRQLAILLPASPIAIIKQLMRNGIMANINHVIDFERRRQ